MAVPNITFILVALNAFFNFSNPKSDNYERD